MTLQQIYDNSSALKLTVRDYLLLQIYAQTPQGGATNSTTLTSSVENSSSAIAEGSLAVTFTTSDDFAGTINGVTRSGGTSYVFNPTVNFRNPEIPYTISAGTILIDTYTAN